MHCESFLCRISAIQKCLGDNPLLVVPGVDGALNKGSQQLVKYIFEGASGLSALNSSITDSNLEDTFLLIRKDSLDIFCNPFVRERVIAITAATEKVTLHCQGSKQTYMDNMEENEAFKIKVFLDLMDGCQGISIPIQADATSQRDVESNVDAFDDKQKMVIEKWPLVQAHALQDAGRNTFFTVLHKVYPFQALAKMFSQVDARFLENILQTALPSMRSQWKRMVSLAASTDSASRAKLSEASVAEPLVTFHSYALMGLDDLIDHAGDWALSSTPRVLFGARTVAAANNASSGKRSKAVPGNSWEAEAGSTGSGGAHALHFTAEATDPASGLSVARSYFFTTGGASLDGVALLTSPPDKDTPKWGSAYKSEDEEPFMPARLMLQLYSFLISVVESVMDSFALPNADARLDSAKLAVHLLHPLVSPLVDCQALPESWRDIESLADKHFELTLQCVDAFGMRSPYSQTSAPIKKYIYVRAVLKDVPAYGAQEQFLGSLVYGDSFGFSSAHGPGGSGGGGVSSGTGVGQSVACLTKSIPRLVAWPGQPLMEAEISEIVLPRYLDEAERKRTSSFKTIGKHSLLGPLILDSHDAISHSKPVSFAPMTWEEGHDSLPHSILGSSSFQEDHGASKSILGVSASKAWSVLTGLPHAPMIGGRVCCFDKGFTVSQSSVGSFVVSFAHHAAQALWFDGDSYVDEATVPDENLRSWLARVGQSLEGCALFVLLLLEAPQSGLFKSLRFAKEIPRRGKKRMLIVNPNTSPSLAIVLPKGSNALRSFTKFVLPTWRSIFKDLDIRCDNIGLESLPSPIQQTIPQSSLSLKAIKAAVVAAATFGFNKRGGKDHDKHLRSLSPAYLAFLTEVGLVEMRDARGDAWAPDAEQGQTPIKSSSSSTSSGGGGSSNSSLRKAAQDERAKSPGVNGNDSSAKPMDVILVLGQPGVGLTDVTEAVNAASGNEQQWHVLDLFIDSFAGVSQTQEENCQRVANILFQAANEQRKTTQRGSIRRHRLLTLCSGYYSARHAASVLQRAIEECNRMLRDNSQGGDEENLLIKCELAEVCCFVSAASFFEGKSTSATVPSALDQCSRGFVGSVLLLSSCNLLADEDARKRIEAVNPTMQVFKIKRDNMRLCILSVMSHRIFQDPSQNTLRERSFPEWKRIAFSSAGNQSNSGAAVAAFSFGCAVKARELVKACRKLVRNRGPDGQQVRFVQGFVRTLKSQTEEGEFLEMRVGPGAKDGGDDWDDDEGPIEFEWLEVGSHQVRLRRDQTGGNQLVTVGGESFAKIGQSSSFVTFYGTDLQRNRLGKELLEVAFPTIPRVSSLSKDEMRSLQRKHVSMPPLPSGWFYDGQTFTDGEGDQHEFRPDFESIMIQHLKTLNQRISDKEAAEAGNRNAMAQQLGLGEHDEQGNFSTQDEDDPDVI